MNRSSKDSLKLAEDLHPTSSSNWKIHSKGLREQEEVMSKMKDDLQMDLSIKEEGLSEITAKGDVV